MGLEVMVARAIWRALAVGALALGITYVASAGPVFAAEPQQDVQSANAIVQRSLAEAREGDLDEARAAYAEYASTWRVIEDGVKAASRDSYRAIETSMRAVSRAFAADPLDSDQVIASLESLDGHQRAFAKTASATSIDIAATDGAGTVGTLLDMLGKAQVALNNTDYATAAARLQDFEHAWPSMEGQVKTRSADDYRQTEDDMALASTLAAQRSPEALSVVNRMAARLEPYREAQPYGVFDAAIILLREGLEALLVMVALSAVLKKSGNTSGQRWLWGGAVGGLLFSVGLGLSIQAFLGGLVNPGNRELIEGVTGLVAASMLVYVSYWLHSKSSLSGWQAYIKGRTTDVLAGGRVYGLALLAFLAVFREGAETSLFYLGMASHISNTDLLLGLGVGGALLSALGFCMLVVGVRIPMRPFFTVASVLVFYLCFKFIGAGIHSLQVAQVIPDGSAGFLLSVDALGVYPTWPTTLAQLILLSLGAWVVVRRRLRTGRSVRLTRMLASLSAL
jgi:high-affinity iron transporter